MSVLRWRAYCADHNQWRVIGSTDHSFVLFCDQDPTAIVFRLMEGMTVKHCHAEGADNVYEIYASPSTVQAERRAKILSWLCWLAFVVAVVLVSWRSPCLCEVERSQLARIAKLAAPL